MSIDVEIFEVTGPSPGTATAISNVNFKNSGVVGDAYYVYPIKRPTSVFQDFGYSYPKWVYFRIRNTSGYVKNLKLNISLSEAGSPKTKLYCAWRNSYVEPTNAGDHSLTYVKDRAISLYPLVSSSSPAAATSHMIVLQPNVYYYTNYLVLQTAVGYNEQTEEVGNADSIKLEFTFDSF